MKADSRRAAILDLLSREDRPISGAAIAQRFDVSRQVVVGDISALKAEGHDILSTHYGYVLQRAPLIERIFKVLHGKDKTEDELNTIVDLGGTVVNVFVWHKVYGRLEAPLNIANRQQVELFMEGVRSGKSTELMNITGGYHYHAVRATSVEALDKIERALNLKGYIAPEI